jgi:competence protein ComEA
MRAPWKLCSVMALAMVLFFALGTAVQAETKIDINKASIEALQSLPGIGPALAERIEAYRSETPFKTIEDLKKVKGIGDVTFEKMKHLIKVE